MGRLPWHCLEASSFREHRLPTTGCSRPGGGVSGTKMSTTIETITVTRPMKVIAFTCTTITVFLMIGAVSSSDWVNSEGWREGLFVQCIDEGAPTPIPFSDDPTPDVGCHRAHSAGYVRGTAALIVICVLTDFYGTLLTGLGLRSTDPNKKYKYYRVAIYALLVSTIALFLALIIYPVSFSKDIDNAPNYDGGKVTARISLNLSDLDGDGIPDLFDNDDDGDGTPDTEDTDDDNDGTPDEADNDDDVDGMPDDQEPDFKTSDFDGDGTPDNEDDDDDNDGIKDDVDPDDDNDGTPDAKDEDDDNEKDTDGDGLVDKFDTDDDNDGVEDSRDNDDDNDGTPDYSENDADNDGEPDDQDNDDDNDGLPDHLEEVDSDGDGVPDIDDDDDDNYGIKDTVDKDDDNDGIPDDKDLTGQARVWQFGFGYGTSWFSVITLFASVTLLICDRESEEIFYKERPAEDDEEAGGED